MSDTKEIKCSCGHIGHASYREKDNPYSSYGIWSFSNFNCISDQVEKPVQMSYGEALQQAEPKCPNCGAKVK